MKNSKINKNRNNPPPEEIEASKNFDFVLKNSKTNKNYSLKILGLIGIALLTFVVSNNYFGLKENASVSNKKEIIKNRINKPLKNIEIPFGEFRHHPKDSVTINTKLKSIINIPKDAFLSQNGELFSDSVMIKYRKFETVSAIFLSGIPMIYDSASVEYHFESAGMFEIRAYDLAGNVLNVNPQSRIEIEMSSSNSDLKFNQYYLTNDSVWEYLGRKNPIVLTESNSKLFENRNAIIKSQIKKSKQKADSVLKANLPKIPKTADNDRFALNLEFNPKSFPELAPFDNILFEVLPNNPEFKLQEVKENWNDIELIKREEKYFLILFKNGKKRTINVQPVVSEGINIQKAKEVYDKLLLNFSADKTNLYHSIQLKIDSLQKINKQLTDSVKTINLIEKSSAYQISEQFKNESKVYRIFSVNNFGIYNSDCPSNLPRGRTLESPIFVDKENVKDTLVFTTMFIAEYGKNALYRLYAGFNDVVSYNPKNKTVLWGVTKKNKLAVVYLNKEKGRLKNEELEMELLTINVATNTADIRKLLKWN